MGRSHLLLAGAGYAALAARPLDTPLGALTAPVLGGGPAPDGAGVFVLSLGIAAACGLAPDIDKAGSTAARSLGVVTRVLSWGIERSFGHRGGFHSLLGVALGFFLGDLLGGLLGLTGLGGSSPSAGRSTCSRTPGPCRACPYSGRSAPGTSSCLPECRRAAGWRRWCWPWP